LPGGSSARADAFSPRRADLDLENDLWVRAQADEQGELKSIRLGDAPVSDLAALSDRLRRYVQILEGRPLRVRLVADDGLRYEDAARLMTACTSAGASSIRLADPSILNPSPSESRGPQ
jgi:biopolymer transport protein ExbD